MSAVCSSNRSSSSRRLSMLLSKVSHSVDHSESDNFVDESDRILLMARMDILTKYTKHSMHILVCCVV